MAKILDRLPIIDRRTDERFGDRHIRAHRDQILVWMSVYFAGVPQPESQVPVLPALLDTGNNFDFSIQYRHMREWADLDPALLAPKSHVEINEQTVECREAAVWIYPNIPDRRAIAPDREPFRLRMPRGIAVYPRSAVPPGPRLPLLGLPALLNNDLDFWLDPDRRHVTVQTRTWRRRVMRLLCRL